MGKAASHFASLGLVCLLWLASPLWAEVEKVTAFQLPFLSGKSYEVIQGNGGKFSHQSPENRYAWDFAMPVGTKVCAAAEGRVVGLRESSRTGGKDPAYANKANWIQIDHGGGVYSLYYHLNYHGVWVRLGQKVRAGQVIGQSGETGYTASPHLHFSAIDCRWKGVPSHFVDYPNNAGIPQTGAICRAVGQVMGLEAFQEDSCLPSDTFERNGILNFEGMNSVLLVEGREYQWSGKVRDGVEKVKWRILSPVADDVVAEGEARLQFGRYFRFTFIPESWKLYWPENPSEYALMLEGIPVSAVEGKVRVPIALLRK
jgi:murein DD-endopeptidase MepM/ murein hydrolase activator NlpD